MRLLDEIQHLASAKTDAARNAQPAGVLSRGTVATPAVVNDETLGHLEELGSSLAFVEKLIRVFLADSAAIMERIEKVLAARDYHEFRSLVQVRVSRSVPMLAEEPFIACTSERNS